MPRYVLQISARKSRELRALFASRTCHDLSFEAFLIELLEVPHLTDFRQQNQKPRPEPLAPESAFKNPVSADRPQRGLSPEVVQEIIFLYFIEKMNISDIARRKNLGASTVGRVVRAHSQSQTRTLANVGQCRTRKPTAESRAFARGQ